MHKYKVIIRRALPLTVCSKDFLQRRVVIELEADTSAILGLDIKTDDRCLLQKAKREDEAASCRTSATYSDMLTCRGWSVLQSRL